MVSATSVRSRGVGLSLGTVASEDFTIRFGRPEHRAGTRWHATIEGMPFVWLVESRAVELYAAPIEEFLDHVLTRIPVSEADAASLELDGRELRLWVERENERAKPVWMVSERPSGAAPGKYFVAADALRMTTFGLP